MQFRAKRSVHAFDRHAGRRFADLYEGDTGYNAHEYAVGGAPFIVLKATEGIAHTDSKHAIRCENSHAAGLAVGHYHFFHEDGHPEMQARHFWDVVRGHFLVRWPAGRGHDSLPLSHTDFLIVDIEGQSGNVTAGELNNFNRELLRLAGENRTLIGYANKAYIMERPNVNVPSRKWWVADYPNFPGNIGRNRILWGHQFTDAGTIPGVAQKCDCSVISDRASIRYWERQ